MRSWERGVGADRTSARGRAPVVRTGWGLAVAALLSVSAWAEPPAAPRREGEASSDRVWGAAPAKPAGTAPKAGVARRPRPKAGPSDELRLLGDVKVLDVKDGEALFRIDGQEQTLRPGMLLKSDLIKAITRQRMVLLRPESVDEQKGETRIIVEFVAPGRNRVRMYAARNWTSRPLRPVE